MFFYVIVAGAGGEPVYREWTRDPLSLRTAFTPAGLSSRRFYRSVVVGYGFAAAHIAFLVWHGERYRVSFVPCPSSASDAVNIILRVFWQVIIDD